jgi:membrane protease YdiL (CAAX protease family)
MIALQLLLEVVLRLLRIDTSGIGNATFPAPGEWQPSVPIAILLLAVLPAVVEEYVFRGVLFGALRSLTPLAAAVVISSGLFGLSHLSADMAPANVAFVFANTFAFGCLAAIALRARG